MKYKIAATLSVCTLVLLAHSLSFASTTPTSEEVKKVSSYFYNPDVSTPVLADFKLCTGIHREGMH
ncbi:MAG: hypothetical protein AAF420_05635 [Pseudomonadota bacterium]